MARTRARLRRQLRKQTRSAAVVILLIVLGALFMLLNVTLRVQVTELAQEVEQLRRQRQALSEEHQVQVQRVEELSSFGRIHRVAKTKLNMRFPSTETVADAGQE